MIMAPYHRKVELLKLTLPMWTCCMTVTGYGRDSGWYPSADGRRRYRVQTFGARWLLAQPMVTAPSCGRRTLV